METPGKAKRAGKYLQLRFDWNDVKLSIMEDLVREKFINNWELSEKLLNTKDAELIEGNCWGDTFWGMDLRHNPPIGGNHLGKILMKVRDELKKTTG